MSCSDAETRAPAGKDRYPLRVLFWEATLRCNLFCEFCGSRCGETDTSNELTAEEICGVFKDVAGHYDASRIMINVSGGEPLLRKDLFDIMAYAVSLGYAWGIVTNGTLLTPETVARLDQCSLCTASVSIDGLKEVHDDLRGRQGCFDRTVQGIRNLKSAKSLEHLMVTTVVSKKNIHQLAPLREFLKSLPIHSWRVCPVDPIGRAADNSGVQLNQDEIRQMLDFIAESRRMGLPFQVTTSCSHYLGQYEYLVRDQHFQCFAGRQMGSVLANGDIFVCPNVPRRPELIQGSVRQDSFSRVWETGFACFRDDSARRVGKCARCAQYPHCRGDSLHTWNFDSQAPNFCARDLGLLPAPDRSLPEKNTLAAVLDAYRTGEAQSLVIAGMGGRIMGRILLREPDKTLDFKELILQPQADPEVVRRALRGLGLSIDRETLVHEDGKFYPVMHVIHGRQLHPDWGEADPAASLACEDLFGPVLLSQKDPVLHRFLSWRKNVNNRILQSLTNAQDCASGAVLQKEGEVRHMLSLLELSLSLYG